MLRLGYRVPATAGAHQITIAIAHAAVGSDTDAFAPATGERFRQGRHESEYFDPTRRVDKTRSDTGWAVQVTAQAITAVAAALQSS